MVHCFGYLVSSFHGRDNNTFRMKYTGEYVSFTDEILNYIPYTAERRSMAYPSSLQILEGVVHRQIEISALSGHYCYY